MISRLPVQTYINAGSCLSDAFMPAAGTMFLELQTLITWMYEGQNSFLYAGTDEWSLLIQTQVRLLSRHHYDLSFGN
jgi:hypothetical protein